MKQIQILFLILFSISQNLNAQNVPFVIKNTGTNPINLLNAASSSATVIDHLPAGNMLVAWYISYGYYEVDLPDPSGATSAYVLMNSVNLEPDCNIGYVDNTASTSPGSVNIRTCAGCTGTTQHVMIGTNYAYSWYLQYFAIKSTTVIGSTTWYEIYLTGNCSQTSGWLGAYCNPNSSNSNALSTPTLSSPSVSANTIDLSWSNISLATKYDIYKNSVLYSQNFMGTSITVSGLTPNTSYSFYVVAKNNMGCISNNSNTVTTSTSSGGSVPVAYFNSGVASISVGQSITYTDVSSNNPTAWNWTFPGGTPSSSTLQNPTIYYNTAGTYNVSLQAYNNIGWSSIFTANSYVHVTSTGSATINLSGNMSFGNIQTGSTSQKTLTITNTGTSTLAVSSIIYPSGFSGDWSGGNISVGSNNSQNINVTFSPTSASFYGGNIQVISNSTAGTNTISCSGMGTTAPQPGISLSGNLNFGSVQIGNNSQQTLTITNTGNATLNVSLINCPSGFSGNWSGGDISSGSHKDITITFAPTSIASYGNSIVVTSNAGTNSISCSGIGIGASTPSNITINNIIQNNSSFPSPKQLWQGRTDQTASTIKICADGSKATEITFVNNTGINSNNIRFLIASDKYGNNSDVSGYFVIADYHYSSNTIMAKFTHPKYLQAAYQLSRTDNILVIDNNNPSLIIYSIPIQIYRAPVLMVHGLWGDINTFETMENSLDASGYYPSVLTYRTEYYFTNSMSFATNSSVVPNGINTVLSYARANLYSAGKVDIIGHSMGGILTRNYLQSVNYTLKQNIHKIITLNTPHSGSQAANLLLNQTSPISYVARRATNYYLWQFGNIGKSVSDGAVSDLEINSSAIKNLNGALLNNGIVPVHSITTENNFSVYSNDFEELIINAIAPYYVSQTLNTVDLAGNGFLNFLFYQETNDLIVSNSSQTGGLPTSAVSHFYNQSHMGSTANPSIIDEVINGLNKNSADANYFEQSGYSPVDLKNKNYFKKSPTPDTTSLHLKPGSIKITYPYTGQIFNPGDTIPVSINSSNGINKIIFEGISSASNFNIKNIAIPSGIINYPIPKGAFGKVGIIVFGYDTALGFIDCDTVSVNININSILDSISFYPSDTIYIQSNGIFSANLKGYFNNGTSNNVSWANGIQFQVSDTNIAKPYLYNLIEGKNIGSTLLFATYLGKTRTIPVVVVPRDSSINITTSIPLSPNLNETRNSNILNIFPNPNNGDFWVQLETTYSEIVSTEIYNQIGQKIYYSNEMAPSNTFVKSISLSGVSSGIYLVKVSTKSDTFNRKVLLTK